MLDIGGSLAEGRKGLHLTPSDAERLTLLRWRYLEALEHNEFDRLPGRAYARAFLRTYACALGLDADPLVAEFDARYPEPAEPPTVAVIRPRRARRIRGGLVAALTAVAAALGAVVWAASSHQGQVAPLSLPRAAPAPSHARHAAARPPTPPRPSPLVISATGGPCWLLVRRDGPAGPVVYEGTLAQGGTMRFVPRVWVRLGAPWNVKLHRGARVVPEHAAAATPVDLIA